MNELQKEFEETGYLSWINSDLYPNGKIYTQEYTEWLERKVKNNVDLADVSQRSELLKLEDKEIPFDEWLNKYFKSNPTTELIYRQKNNNREFTERELIKMYKQAYQL